MPKTNVLLASFYVGLLLIAWLILPKACYAQSLLDMSQFKHEHLITQVNGGETGDLSIYVSFPNWFGNAGYCPVRVRVVPKKGLKFKNDGQLKVMVGARSGAYDLIRNVVIDVPIESGTSEATREVLGNFLFENSRMQMNGISAKLNGRVLRGQAVYLYNTQATGGRECKNLILISTESSKDDARRLEAMAEMSQTQNWFSQVNNASSVQHTSAYADVRTMPANWLNLSSLEHVSIDFQDLDHMDNTRLDCLNNYVMAGGVLTVTRTPTVQSVARYLPLDLSRQYGKVGGDPKNKVNSAPKSNRLLSSDFESPRLDVLQKTIWDDFLVASGVSALSQPNPYSSNFYPQTGLGLGQVHDWDWLTESMVDVGKTYIDSHLASPITFASQIFDAVSNASPPADGGLSGSVFVAHGFGTVCLDNRRRSDQSNVAETALPARAAIPARVVNANLSFQSYTTNTRSGRVSSGIGDDFWHWLIPSVGRTPVIAFLAFVVLFVGVAAPGIMVWSQAHKRRVWLVVLMPITAAVCTLFLFSYGILKDGFGAVSRTRSLSFIDEKGNGMVWSRQSYFAATLPSQGIAISKETHFVPLISDSFMSLPNYEYIDTQEAQMYRGMLLPRLQSQFSITHPLRGLTVLKRGPDSDPMLNGPAILNASDFKWDLAVLVDKNNEFFVADNVEAGQRAVCTSITKDDAVKAMQKAYKSQLLTPPSDSPSVDQTSLGRVFSEVFNYRFKNGSANATGQITEENTWTSHLGLTSSTASPIDKTVNLPGTFVIFSSDAPYLERCLSAVKDKDGLHTIIGRW